MRLCSTDRSSIGRALALIVLSLGTGCPPPLTVDDAGVAPTTDAGADPIDGGIDDERDAGAVDAGDDTLDIDADRIEDLMTAALGSEASTAALGLAIVHGDEVVFAQARGTTGADGSRASPETLFSVGSVSKMLTGYALVTLADDGAIDLSDPVVTWVPELTSADDISGVTVNHLLAHTGGLGSNNDTYYGSLEGFFAANALDVWVGPGTLFNYSNLGYNLAGLVAARAHGATSTYADAFRATTATDLGFVHATADRQAAQARAHADCFYGEGASGYWIGPDDLDDFSMPSGGVWLSAVDLGRLLVGMLGHHADPAVAARLATWTSPRVVTRGAAGQSYASGLFLEDGRLPRSVEHSGSIAAYVTNAVVFPALDLGVAVIASSSTVDLWSLQDAVLDELGVDVVLNPDTPPIALDQASLPGTYADPTTYGDMVVSTSNGAVTLALPDVGGAPQTLYEVEPNVFFYEDPIYGVFLDITFWPDDSGAVQYAVTRLGVGHRVTE